MRKNYSHSYLNACAVALLPIFVIGCGGSDNNSDTGTVNTTVYGESFIEDGIPDNPADGSVDGWAVTFDKFELIVEDVTIGGKTVVAATTLDISGSTGGAGTAIGSVTLGAGTHDNASFAFDQVRIEGSATNTSTATTKTFSWLLDAPTRYAQCHNQTVVTDGGESTFEITVHADHIFWDSFIPPVAPNDYAVRFQAMADADTNGNNDGIITQEELDAVDRVTELGSIGNFYNVGTETGIDSLWDYMLLQATTLGHVNGEGHCDDVTALPKNLTVTTFGESFIEDGIPNNPADGAVDGWAVDFSKFEVTFEDISVNGIALLDPAVTVDVSEISAGDGHDGHVLGHTNVPAGDYNDNNEFTITKVVVEGEGTDGVNTKSFAWEFDVPTHYAQCHTDETNPTTVTANGDSEFQITIHADHLFWDSFIPPVEPNDFAVRFQPMADADINGDNNGVITVAELQAVDLVADLGSVGNGYTLDAGRQGVTTLWDYIVLQATTLGHLNGEGHCDDVTVGTN